MVQDGGPSGRARRWLGVALRFLIFRPALVGCGGHVEQHCRTLSSLRIAGVDVVDHSMVEAATRQLRNILASIDSGKIQASETCTVALDTAVSSLAQLVVPSNASPPTSSLPFFAYGIFAPGEIAFFQIKSFVVDAPEATTITGEVLLRDGVPILDTKGQGLVNGFRIRFRQQDAEAAYRAIQDMEPERQYRWVEIAGMNVLVGRSPGKGAKAVEEPEKAAWSSWSDAAFVHALELVQESVREPIMYGDLKLFFRLQGAYMVLWSSIERYVSLRYSIGRSEGVMQRLFKLADEPCFKDALLETALAAERDLRTLYRSDSPTQSVKFEREGSPKKAIEYFYLVRSNVTHRGKAERIDWPVLQTAAEELLRIFLYVFESAKDEARWADEIV